MRISADKNDSGYIDPMELNKYRVKLDGFRQELVITADEQKGLIIRVRRNEDGSLMVNGDYLVTEVVHGKVEIIKLR